MMTLLRESNFFLQIECAGEPIFLWKDNTIDYKTLITSN
jgi:hypothetical protein